MKQYQNTALIHLPNNLKLFAQSVWKFNGLSGKNGIFTDLPADCRSVHDNVWGEGPEICATMSFFLIKPVAGIDVNCKKTWIFGGFVRPKIYQ